MKVSAVLSCCVAQSGLSLMSQDDVSVLSSRLKMFEMSLEDRTNTLYTNISNKLPYAAQQPRSAKIASSLICIMMTRFGLVMLTGNVCVLLKPLENY